MVYPVPGEKFVEPILRSLSEEVEPAADGDLAPRCVKDLIEEALFERRRDLFSELGLVC